MNGLLSCLTDSFFSAVPSPDPKRAPSRRRVSPVKPKSRPVLSGKPPVVITADVDVDMAALVDGAENWDWDDMESDFLTPKKNRTTKVDAQVDTAYTPELCTRCIVERVVENDNGGRFTKVLMFIRCRTLT